MPFRIFNGRNGQQRLIVTNPTENDQASVLLVDGARITVAPSMTIVNGYPGIKALPDDLPDSVLKPYQAGIRAGVNGVKAVRDKSRPEVLARMAEYYASRIETYEKQPLICASIAIGREMLLVLPSGLFPERNRFTLPYVEELDIHAMSRLP